MKELIPLTSFPSRQCALLQVQLFATLLDWRSKGGYGLDSAGLEQVTSSSLLSVAFLIKAGHIVLLTPLTLD